MNPISGRVAEAIEAILRGEYYSLTGLQLTMNGQTLTLTDEEFDAVYAAMDEVDGNDSILSLP